jgi:hypothetical protein
VYKRYFLCESGNEFVAPNGQLDGHAACGGGKLCEEQEAAGGEGGTEFRREARRQAAGGAKDDRLATAEEDAQAFLFDRGVKAADDAAAGVAPVRGLVVGGQQGIAGAVTYPPLCNTPPFASG